MKRKFYSTRSTTVIDYINVLLLNAYPNSSINEIWSIILFANCAPFLGLLLIPCCVSTAVASWLCRAFKIVNVLLSINNILDIS